MGLLPFVRSLDWGSSFPGRCQNLRCISDQLPQINYCFVCACLVVFFWGGCQSCHHVNDGSTRKGANNSQDPPSHLVRCTIWFRGFFTSHFRLGAPPGLLEASLFSFPCRGPRPNGRPGSRPLGPWIPKVKHSWFWPPSKRH